MPISPRFLITVTIFGGFAGGIAGFTFAQAQQHPIPMIAAPPPPKPLPQVTQPKVTTPPKNPIPLVAKPPAQKNPTMEVAKPPKNPIPEVAKQPTKVPSVVVTPPAGEEKKIETETAGPQKELLPAIAAPSEANKSPIPQFAAPPPGTKRPTLTELINPAARPDVKVARPPSNTGGHFSPAFLFRLPKDDPALPQLEAKLVAEIAAMNALAAILGQVNNPTPPPPVPAASPPPPKTPTQNYNACASACPPPSNQCLAQVFQSLLTSECAPGYVSPSSGSDPPPYYHPASGATWVGSGDGSFTPPANQPPGGCPFSADSCYSAASLQQLPQAIGNAAAACWASFNACTAQCASTYGVSQN
jgi:hypothetical protein